MIELKTKLPFDKNDINFIESISNQKEKFTDIPKFKEKRKTIKATHTDGVYSEE